MQITFIFFFNDILPHEPPFQASSSQIPRIRIWPIERLIPLNIR